MPFKLIRCINEDVNHFYFSFAVGATLGQGPSCYPNVYYQYSVVIIFLAIDGSKYWFVVVILLLVLLS